MKTDVAFLEAGWRRDAARGALTFCDISTFYCAKGGGITTYHRAKLDWFASQSRHRYVLVAPGPRFRVTPVSEAAAIVEAYGPTLGHGPEGYRLLVDFGRLSAVLRQLRPDVVETGDPWVSGPLALLARQRGHFDGVLTSFFHADPFCAYVEPWMHRRKLPRRIAGPLLDTGMSTFWRVQRLYDYTVVASRAMFDRLESNGLRRVLRTPFGIDARWLATPPTPASQGRPVKLLYAGRLQKEKGIDMVLELIPRVIDPPAVTLTIAGDGPEAARLARLARPGVNVLGHVGDRQRVEELFRSHDILLSPAPAETFGLAALEAMACGMVVVGTRTGGIGELLRSAESPFQFQPGDHDDFVSTTMRAVEADRQPQASRGRAAAERYGTWHDAVSRQVALYEAVADERHPRR